MRRQRVWFLTPWGTPYKGPYGEDSLSLSEVYKREAKSVISVGKNSQKGWQIHFLAVKKSREREKV